MKVNTNTIQKITKLQEEKKIINNKLLVFSLSLNAGVITAVKTIQEELSLLDEEIVSFTKLLIENDLLNKSDLEIINKLEKTSIITTNTFDNDVKEILNHLNFITSSNKRFTDKRIKLIEQWLRRGYSIEQFFMVNLYFNDKWGNDPEMSTFVRAETLYNTKFESKVEEAEEKFREVFQRKDDIETICNFYKSTYDNLICKIDISCNLLPLKTQKLIVFWLKKYDLNIILKTIEIYLQTWSKKIDLAATITLDKILDKEFATRVSFVAKRRQVEDKSGVDNWLSNNEEIG